LHLGGLLAAFTSAAFAALGEGGRGDRQRGCAGS
jgi:hypothetical protein